VGGIGGVVRLLPFARAVLAGQEIMAGACGVTPGPARQRARSGSGTALRRRAATEEKRANPHAQRLGRLAQTIDYATGFSDYDRY
jgi:hypothetical protein